MLSSTSDLSFTQNPILPQNKFSTRSCYGFMYSYIYMCTRTHLCAPDHTLLNICTITPVHRLPLAVETNIYIGETLNITCSKSFLCEYFIVLYTLYYFTCAMQHNSNIYTIQHKQHDSNIRTVEYYFY